MITAADRTSFRDHGYLRIPGVVPRDLIDRALRAINHNLGNGIDPAQMAAFYHKSFCPELQSDPVILDLIDASPARPLIEQLTGPLQTTTAAQIALRFPSMSGPGGKVYPHIDGMYTPSNGVPKGTIFSFTALAGVLLSDQTNEDAGNFTVWPGTHLEYGRYFAAHGAKALLAGMPPITLPKPVQVTGRAGDLVIAHYLLGHGGSPNLSPNIRYITFYRLFAVDLEQHRLAALEDPWLDWPGIRAL